MAAKKFYTSSLTKTGVGVESTYGTAATSFIWPGNVQMFSLIPSNVTMVNRSQNVNREAHSVDVLQKLYRGGIKWRVQNGAMFYACYGSKVTTGTGTPYTHTFTVGEDLPSFSAYNHKAGRGAQSDINDIYTGCKVNKLTLSCSEQGYLEAETDNLSNGKASTTDKTITSISTTAFRFADITNSAAIVDGNSVKIVGFKYTLENKLTDEQEGDSIAEPNAQEAVQTLEITFKLSDEVVRDAIAAGAEIEVSIPFVRGANDTLTLTCQCTPKEAPESPGVEGPIEVTASFDVRTSTLVVVNSTAAYTI